MNLTKLCVSYLTKQLKKDKNFYETYKSNIAMCVYDSFLFLAKNKRERIKIHILANVASQKFTDMWIN